MPKGQYVRKPRNENFAPVRVLYDAVAKETDTEINSSNHL